MVRPKHCRTVSGRPEALTFKPAGVPKKKLKVTVLSIDEFEAIRLADHLSMYQEEAAEKMGVSRQTFGRIIAEARGKVARMLVYGQALMIEGGNVELSDKKHHVTCAGINDCDGSCMEFPDKDGDPEEEGHSQED
jgi:predicted DNA-binding protein (UPF0251 family)